VRRTLIPGLALSLATASALVGALAIAPATTPAASAAKPHRGPELTDFGFRSDVYGVKLVTDNVEAFDVKDAHAQLRCTRALGQTVERTSALSVPGNPLVHVAASTSRTDTYRDGQRNGVRGVNTIGDIRIGGTVNGVATPTLVIDGLTTTADAFHTPQGFGHAESFDFARIRLELLAGTPLQGTPLEQLLAPLQQVTDTVFEGTGEAANEVFAVLRSATAPIQIPGLGSIALGKVRGKASGKRATSEAMALEVVVDAGGRRQLLEIGSANARIGAPAPAGVFRAGGTALDFQALQGALHFGGVQHKSLPCEGTLGKTQTFRVPSASLLFGLVADLRDVTYTHKGSQVAKRDFAKGLTGTRIETVSVPAVGLVVNGVESTVRMRGTERKPVRARVATTISSITMNGQPVSVPAPGRTAELPNGAGLVQRELVKRSRYGARVIALRVKLFQQAVVLDLGLSDGHIYPR
jgi:hypothetical protein